MSERRKASMNFNEIWNKIVVKYKEKRNSEEYVLQNLWEQIFREYMNYNSLDNEILAGKQIPLGSTSRLIPDIILRKDDKDFAVVELKKATYNTCDEFRNQLFSYLKQLKVSIGVLITNKIEVFFYDYQKEDDKQQSVVIEFTENNTLGEQFVFLFEKHNVDINAVKKFVADNCKIKDDLIEIASLTNENLIKDILKSYLTEKGYNNSAIEKFMENLKIDIRKSTETNNIEKTFKPQTKIERYYPEKEKKSYIGYNLDRNRAIQLCEENNVQLSKDITFANMSNVCIGKYPANVNTKHLDREWNLLLNDGFNKQLHILKIPPYTFTPKNFYIRPDNGKIVLIIDKNFVDTHPKENIENRLSNYKIKTINY